MLTNPTLYNKLWMDEAVRIRREVCQLLSEQFGVIGKEAKAKYYAEEGNIVIKQAEKIEVDKAEGDGLEGKTKRKGKEEVM